MAALGWIMPTIDSVANHALATPWLKTMDLRLSWPIKVKDRVTIEPSASVFNVFNFANAFQSGNMPSASLLPGPERSVGTECGGRCRFGLELYAVPDEFPVGNVRTGGSPPVRVRIANQLLESETRSRSCALVRSQRDGFSAFARANRP